MNKCSYKDVFWLPCGPLVLLSSGLCSGSRDALVLVEVMMCIKPIWLNMLISKTVCVHVHGSRSSSLYARRSSSWRLEEDGDRKCWVLYFLKHSVRHHSCHVSVVTMPTQLSLSLSYWRRALGLSFHCRDGRWLQQSFTGCCSKSKRCWNNHTRLDAVAKLLDICWQFFHKGPWDLPR